MSKKNVSVAEPEESETALVATVGGVPAEVAELFEQDAGAGTSDMSAGDLAMPFLTILQKMSPQVDDTSPKYIDGARAGMILNTLTGELYDGKVGIEGIVCGYQKLVTKWGPRESGGGFKGHLIEDSDVYRTSTINDKNKRIASDGDLLIDTAYYFIIAKPQTAPFQAMVSMSSTQLKKSRKWNSLMKGIILKTASGKSFNPPMYSHVFLLQTEPEQNDQGSWYGWKITTARMVDDPDLVQQARAIHDQVKSGQIKTGAPPAESVENNPEVPF